MNLFNFHDFFFVLQMNGGWMIVALLLGILAGWFTSGDPARKER